MRDNLHRFLSQLTEEDEKKRTYELRLTKFVVENDPHQLSPLLREMLEDNTSDQTAYNAFYCLNILYRRTKDYKFLQDLFDDYEQRFSAHITFNHLRALFDIESESLYDYSEILDNTYKDACQFCDNAGFVHLFADAFVSIYEKGSLHNMDAFLQMWYDRACDAVNRAIELDPSYAKYYCTKARLLCIKKEYKEASTYINMAISYENSHRADYPLRISNYQYVKVMIETKKQLDALERQMLKMANQNLDAEATERLTEIVEPYCGTEPYVFISYSRMDTDDMNRIAAILAENGIRRWFDRGIPGGMEYAEVIAERIMHAKAFLLLISPDSIDSEFVRKELQLALDCNLKPHCVFLKETTLTAGMHLLLGIHQHIFMHKMSKSDFKNKLLDGLQLQREDANFS